MYRIILLIFILIPSFSYASDNYFTDTDVIMLQPYTWITTNYTNLSEKEKQYALGKSNKCPEVYSVKIGKPIEYSYYNENNKTIIMLKFSEYQRFIRLINNAVYYYEMFRFLDKQYQCSNFMFFDIIRNTLVKFKKSGFVLTTYFKSNFDSFEYKYNPNNADYIFFSIDNTDFKRFVQYVEYVYNIVNYSSKSFYKYNKLIEK